MRVVELGSTIGVNPDWETKLWAYICTSDGSSCPSQSYCQTKNAGRWCPDDNKERVNTLLDDDSRFLFERYGFIKSESKENCKICKILERLAYENTKDYLEMMGITQPPLPTDIVNWMDTQHTVEIRELPLKVHHGAIWYDNENDEWVIQLSKDDSPVTKRFTLFHEAFHIVCHSKTPSVVKKRGDVAGSFHDFMADYFATCIAMPREWVTDKWAEVRDLDKMARIFAVPRSSMFVRLRQMGLI